MNNTDGVDGMYERKHSYGWDYCHRTTQELAFGCRRVVASAQSIPCVRPSFADLLSHLLYRTL